MANSRSMTTPWLASVLALVIVIYLPLARCDMADLEQPWYLPTLPSSLSQRRVTYSNWQHTLFMGQEPSCGSNSSDPGRTCYWTNSSWHPPPSSGYKEFQVGEALSCLANKRLVFIGDSVTRETMFAFSMLLGFSPWFDFNATNQVWRQDQPPNYGMDHQHLPCKQINNSASSCVREWHIGNVTLAFVFVGELEPNTHLVKQMLGPDHPRPDAVFFNYGIWAAAHHGCFNGYYSTTLRGLIGIIRSEFSGPLYWMSNSPKKDPTGCWQDMVKLASQILGANGVIPIDRSYLAWGDAGLCPHLADVCSGWRDDYHYILPVYTAIAENILNLLCD